MESVDTEGRLVSWRRDWPEKAGAIMVKSRKNIVVLITVYSTI